VQLVSKTELSSADNEVRNYLTQNYMSIDQAVRSHTTLSQSLEKAIYDQNTNN
jgi:hypothetical protein